jgi:serine/arginine repetitive matrix protein 1
MKKVSFDAIKPWITEQITELLKFEDDVLIHYVFSMLEDTQVCPVDLSSAFLCANLSQFPCPKTMQINLTGFLEKNAPAFIKELWVLLLEYDRC